MSDQPLDPSPTPSPDEIEAQRSVGTLAPPRCDGCRGPLPPQKGGGSPKRYCRPACRRKAWDERHPRLSVQAELLRPLYEALRVYFEPEAQRPEPEPEA